MMEQGEIGRLPRETLLEASFPYPGPHGMDREYNLRRR